MKEKKSNVIFVTKALKTHSTSVYENRKALKCEICDYSCSQKADMKKNMVSVHEGKKPSLSTHNTSFYD